MDPALLKDFNAFKKRSLAQPTVESNKRRAPSDLGKVKKKKRQQVLPHQLLQQAKKQAGNQTFNYKTHSQIRTKSRFSILSCIVDLLKSRYQAKEFESLSLDQLLDITKNTDIKFSDREWLERESLANNPKIACKDGKYIFKPKYGLRDRKDLIKLLEKNEQTGMGGVLLDDIREGLPNADDIVKALSDKVTFVDRSNDKKAILFNYDASYAVDVDEEFKKHWRGVAVEGLGEPDIERYLKNSGISSMQGVAPVTKRPEKLKRNIKRRKNMKLHNSHLDGTVLKDYSENGKK